MPTGTTCQNADTAIYTAFGSFSRGRIIFPTGGVGSINTASTNGDTYYDVTAVAERVADGQTLSSIGSSSGYRDATVLNSDTDLVYQTNGATGARHQTRDRSFASIEPRDQYTSCMSG